MGFEVFGIPLAAVAMGALAFYMIKFVVDVILGKYRTKE